MASAHTNKAAALSIAHKHAFYIASYDPITGITIAMAQICEAGVCNRGRVRCGWVCAQYLSKISIQG